MRDTPRMDKIEKFVREQLSNDDMTADHVEYAIQMLAAEGRMLERELVGALERIKALKEKE